MSFDPAELARVVAQAVNGAMDARARINEEAHREHHGWVREQMEDEEVRREHRDWVREQILKQRARNEFWAGLAAKSLPVIAWSLIAAAVGGAWKLFTSHVTWN